MNNSDPNYINSTGEDKNSKSDKSSQDNFFLKEGVKGRKNQVFKIKLQTLILSKGMSEPEFFRKLNISRQRWYYFSWGIWACPDWLKIRISHELNVPIHSIWSDQK